MTRERLPPGTIMQHAYGILDKFKISRSFFVKTDQEGCAIVASDINAAQGITPTSTVPQALGVEQKSMLNGEQLKNISTSQDNREKPSTVAAHIIKESRRK